MGFVSALIPPQYVASLVGDNSLSANFLASLIGAFWYFATLTEVPITQALMRMGMDKGPALALLLAGPALSLPSMIVIGRVMGWKKTAVFCYHNCDHCHLCRHGLRLAGGVRVFRGEGFGPSPGIKPKRRIPMKKVQVLGPGCPKCMELAKRTDRGGQGLGRGF